MSEQKKQITVSGILIDLDNGLSRKEIAEKYDISAMEVAWMFKQPGLIGKRAKKKFVPSFELVQDVEPNVEDKQDDPPSVEAVQQDVVQTKDESANDLPFDIPKVTKEEQQEVAGTSFGDFE
jgi:hypothetical protein